MFGIDRLPIALNDVIVDAVFHEMRTVRGIEEALCISVVFREEQLRRVIAVQPSLTQRAVIEFDSVSRNFAQAGSRLFVAIPRPGIAEPDCRQQM